MGLVKTGKTLALFLLTLEVKVCKVHKLLPVVRGYIVPPRSDVVTDGTVDRLAEPGHFVGDYAIGAQQAVDRIGVPGCKELSTGVRPPILL